MKPECSICKGKSKDNTYIWDGKKLYHKSCFKVAGMKLEEPKVEITEGEEGESVAVSVGTVKAGARAKLIN